MTYPISDLDSITQDHIRLLKSIGIRTTEKLLEAACTAKKRKLLAGKTKVPEQQWLSWANNADRMRIKGVGHDNSKLLQAIGVVTVRELKYRNPRHIAEAMREINNKRKLVRLLPTENAIRRWITAAGKLEPKIRY